MKTGKKGLAYLLVICLILSALPMTAFAAGSTAPSITSFEICDGAFGVINQEQGTVVVTVPKGTDVTALQAKIGLSENAAVSPAGEVAQDFSNGVQYTVTAQNSSAVKVYTVTLAYRLLPVHTGVDEILETQAHLQYMKGYPNGTFGPNRKMTRAEAVSMFYNLLQDQALSAQAKALTFKDVSARAWYSTQLARLVDLGIIVGYSNNTFRPEGNLTRAEFAAIAARFITAADVAGTLAFPDVKQGVWYEAALRKAVGASLFVGDPSGKFRPGDAITRAEVITVVNRLLGRAPDAAFIDANQAALTQFKDGEAVRRHWAYYAICDATNSRKYASTLGGETWLKLITGEEAPDVEEPDVEEPEKEDPARVLTVSKTQETLDAEVVRLYEEWKEKYLKVVELGGEEQAYVWWMDHDDEFDEDSDWEWEDEVTVSEAHGYGMLALVMMSAYDADAQRLFDAMVRFYKNHPSVEEPAFMGWHQVWNEEHTEIIDVDDGDSATDGDLDIAYALAMAKKTWGESQDASIDYQALLEPMLQTIADSLIITDAGEDRYFVRMGDTGSEASTRPSDMMPQHFQLFSELLSGTETKFLKLKDGVVTAVKDLTGEGTGAEQTGILPDYARLAQSEGQAKFVPASDDERYGYNACRIPWRLSMEYIVNGNTDLQFELTKLNNWINTQTQGIPWKISAYYTPDGETHATWSGDPAYTAPFMVSAAVPVSSGMTEAQQQKWLDDLWEFNINQDMEEGGYYDNSIRLLCCIIVSGNWKA